MYEPSIQLLDCSHQPMKSASIDLTITGRKCRTHRNDNVARSLDQGSNLIEISGRQHTDAKNNNWNNNNDDGYYDAPSVKTETCSLSSVLVDRYDARTLLDEVSLQQLSNRHTDVDIDKGIYAADVSQTYEYDFEEGSKEQVSARNFARYGSLAEYSSCFTKDKLNTDRKTDEDEMKLDCKKPSPDNDDEYGGTENTETENTIMQEEKEEPFQPSEEQLKGFPLGIALPKTTRHNNIIELTASRIASNNQLEVFLKVKQANNVDFAFLNPKDELHKYYLHVKAKHSNSKNDSTINEMSKGKDGSDDNNTSDNPLSGLLGGYASSSSSSDESSSADSGKKDGISSTTTTTTTNDDCEGKTKETSLDKGNGAQPDIDTKPPSSLSDELDRKRKADRLERLKAWKESRISK